MKYPKNIQAVADLVPDYMGYIFYEKSPRFAQDLDVEYLNNLAANINRVGVFVNKDFNSIIQICSKYGLNTVQLHGEETPELCTRLKSFGLNVIKAFGVNAQFNFEKLNPFKDCCDFFLFDTKTVDYGGSGKRFNWELLKQYQLNIPYFLSGGISLDDLDEIKKIKNVNMFAIDVNSRLEIEPGLKDVETLKILINRIRNEF